jgi:predicted RND superfamily exporter protein
VVLTGVLTYGLKFLDTDPSLLSYFKDGSTIRVGLDTVDRSGGSSPLKIVVEDTSNERLDTKQADERLSALQEAMERDPAVGTVIALPLVLGEVGRHWYSFLFSDKHWLDILDEQKHGEVARRFIDVGRTKALFLLRMRESDRTAPRAVVIGRLKDLVTARGFRPALVGGTYSLLDQQARLVTSSIVSGALMLVGIFAVMGFAFSRSVKVAVAMLLCLAAIPVVVRGAIAYLGMPLDFVTASAANLDLGMGVDAMIYLTLAARQARKTSAGDAWSAWSHACAELWRPIGTSLLIILSGFGIFLLSQFPPTQRFGAFVMFGSATAAAIALFMFPWLASLQLIKHQPAEAKDR